MLERLRANLRLTPRFASADEAEFCRRWMQQLVLYLYGTIAMSAVLDVAGLVMAHVAAHPDNVPALRITHGLHLVAVLLVRGLVASRPRAARILTMLSAYVFLFGYGFVTWQSVSVIRLPRVELTSATTLLAIAVVYVQACVFDKRVALAFATTSIGVAALAMQDHEGGRVWTVIFGILSMCAWYFYAGRIERTYEDARREYRVRSMIAPAHIVRKSGGSERELAAIFEPKPRPTVCISSDWRNYQQLSATLAPARLAEALNEYYNVCYRLLLERFPEGNYYTDWIADELFVVIFADEGVQEKNVVNAALGFAVELLRQKRVFLERYGLPEAIDIGVSFGDALVGMMGPDHFRKATALGDVPGRARRLQSSGKFLRTRLGEGDRVIFGKDVLMRLSEPLAVQAYDLAKDDRLRDLPDDAVFYVEPGEAGTLADGALPAA